ncbi:hypothetical protein ACHAXR_000319 [Thalassiosira sp. AJA248-18]
MGGEDGGKGRPDCELMELQLSQLDLCCPFKGVRTLSGLYLCKPVDLDKPFKVPDKLIQFERRMMFREKTFLDKRKLTKKSVNMET